MALTPRIRNILIGSAAILALGGGFVLLNRSPSLAATQATDDAYVQADLTVIVPQVSGVVTGLQVTDHQAVKAGDPLISLDRRQLEIDLADAVAKVSAAEAVIAGLVAQRNRQSDVIDQAHAAVASASATMALASANRDRTIILARDGAGTVQARQQAEEAFGVGLATRDSEQAALRAARGQTGIIDAELLRARADLAAAESRRASAALQLSYAQVSAPVAGIVAQRRVRIGGFARMGEPLMTLVPLDAVYIEANFREIQLARIRPGQSVMIAIDALPGVALQGHVESIGPASGVSFSAVPAQNATGNFTKIVQRLPVRIRLDPGQSDVQRLRVGMSVRPTIKVT